MKIFLKSFFASLLALACFTGLALAALLLLAASMGSQKPVVPDKAVLILDLSAPIPDGPRESDPSDAFRQALTGKESESLPLRTLILTLDRAAKDARISGLYITGNLFPAGYASGPAALKELREALQRFRKESGKPVVAYNQGWSKKEYYLCAGLGNLVVNPFGGVEVTGISSEPMFFGEAFKKYGVEVQVTRVGKYKSAVEPFITDRMSEASREQSQKLLDDLWAEWKGTVAADRKLKPEELQRIADERAILLSEEAKASGLVDRIAAHDEVLNDLKKMAGKTEKDREFPQIDIATYAQIPGDAVKGKNRVTVVYAEGDIVDGEGGPGLIGGDKLARELRKLRLDKNVKAVVLRVNSPGGSAAASELIQRETVLMKKEKPLVVSMGTVAASGGYWISAFADRIFAEPNTLTGSIGVFGMLPNVKKLANDHGITFDQVQTARLGNVTSMARPKTEAELARIQATVDFVYEQFLAKVAEGRKLKKDGVHEIAQGRVWSGQEALKLGLVDEFGGLEAAIRHAARAAKIENDYRVDPIGAPKKPIEKLLEALGGGKHRYADARGPWHQLQAGLERQFAVLRSLNDPLGVYARLPLEFELR
ncbi:MAG: signal peptide peptidase SppA [Acidobacteria bacterium]|nr:signal peptide peptidase SppA [Acidobacteriota bacterium]